jgi:hypothetical protein
MKMANTKPNCERHKPFPDRETAVRQMENLRRAAKHTGEFGKSYKRLCVYACGDHWHVGRANNPFHTLPWAQPQQPGSKPPSPGQLRRKLEHERREADRHARRAALFSDYIENQHIAYAELDRELALTAAAARTKS